MALQRLVADHLRAALIGYRDALRRHCDLLNRLNVYPVPDGDTGTNMAATLDAVVADLETASDMQAVCHAMSHGSLMGARGNSGVILSQVLRGLAEVVRSGDDVDAAVFTRALERASEASRQAVMRPVEGTILTAVREAACGARVAADRGGQLADVVDGAASAGHQAVARTPELLAVLAQAGVVDAGAVGLVLFLDVLARVVSEEPLDVPVPPEAADLSVGASSGPSDAPVEAPDEHTVGDLRYEVMYMLEAPDERIGAFKEAWAPVGDSIVVVGGDGLWNCHIHTDDVGAAVEAALDVGRPRHIRVTDLTDAVEEERWVRDAASEGRPAEARAPATDDRVNTAVVAVASGDGLCDIFQSLGVRAVVSGGQSMNPSTRQLLEAVEAVPAEAVVLLPNNGNVVSVARQVDDLTDKQVRVLATVSVAEGLAALLDYDPQADVDSNVRGMEKAAARVRWGEVTRAVRDSPGPQGQIREGDHLGITADGVAVVRPELADAAEALLDALIGDEHELVTVLEGEGSSQEVSQRLVDWLAEEHGHVSVEVHRGDQPLYPYLFSVE